MLASSTASQQRRFTGQSTTADTPDEGRDDQVALQRTQLRLQLAQALGRRVELPTPTQLKSGRRQRSGLCSSALFQVQLRTAERQAGVEPSHLVKLLLRAGNQLFEFRAGFGPVRWLLFILPLLMLRLPHVAMGSTR